MARITGRTPPVAVEYTLHDGTKRRKDFADAHEARRFYTRCEAMGYRPEVKKPLGRVYLVDDARHLVCIPYSTEALHEMAEDLGIKRCWFHGGRNPHYDLPKQRIEEITARCIKVSSRALLTATRMWFELYSSLGNAIDNGYDMLSMTNEDIADELIQGDDTFDGVKHEVLIQLVAMWRVSMTEGGAR